MLYIIVTILAVVITIVVLRFIYKKTKSIKLINSLQLLDGILYKDKLPFEGTIRLKEPKGIQIYFDFSGGNLNRISLYMPDNAGVYWRTGDKYVTCYDREGNSLQQERFESLYSIFVDIDSILAIFNRNFKRCQLTV